MSYDSWKTTDPGDDGFEEAVTSWMESWDIPDTLDARDFKAMWTGDYWDMLDGYIDLNEVDFMQVATEIVWVMENESVPEALGHRCDLWDIVDNHYKDYYRKELKQGLIKREAKEALKLQRDAEKQKRLGK